MWVGHPDYQFEHRSFIINADTEHGVTLFEKPAVKGRVLDSVSRLPVIEFRLHTWEENFDGNVYNDDVYLARVGRNKPESHERDEFAFRPRVVGPGGLAVSAPRYASVLHYFEYLESGQSESDIEILLEPVTQIQGRVIDSNGKPVINAHIYLGMPNRPGQGRGSSRRGIALTNGDGDFQITEYSPTNLFRLTATRDDYVPSWFDVAPPFSNIKIVFKEGARIEGFVTYGGVPFDREKASICFRTDSSRHPEVNIDDNGFYELDKIAEGRLEITVTFKQKYRTKGYIVREIDVHPADALRQDFDFGETNNSYIEGIALIDDQPPLPSTIAVTLYRQNGDQLGFYGQTAKGGTYRLGPLPAAEFEFGSYLEPAFETVTARPGETTNHDLLLTTE